MSVYEIVGVSLPERTPEPLIGSNIDLPKAGSTGAVFTLHIVGWVLGRNSPATAVEVVYQPEPGLVRPGPDRVIRITPIRGDRTDVAAAYPQVPADIDCHFEALVGVVGLTPEFELRLMAVLEDSTRGRSARCGCDHRRCAHPPSRPCSRSPSPASGAPARPG